MFWGEKGEGGRCWAEGLHFTFGRHPTPSELSREGRQGQARFVRRLQTPPEGTKACRNRSGLQGCKGAPTGQESWHGLDGRLKPPL